MVRRISWLLFPAAVAAGLVLWALPSGLVAKKIVAGLLLPAGLVWLGLMAMVAMPGLTTRARAFAVALLLFHTAAGNAWLGGWLIGRLEQPYTHLPAPPAPLDAICVLGGGTSATPAGVPQLGPSGDRVLVPARWFLAGNARHLVASGLSITDIGGSRSLADDTAALWLDLGIPEAAISRLSTPRNTREEIREFKKLASARGWQRVGICTSAWHLRRAAALCQREGLEFVPVPADFLSGPLPVSPLYAVPQARGFQNVQKALWEYLGRAAGG